MTGFIDALPARLVELIKRSTIAEYATVSAAGVPIDTPTYYFPSADLTSLDIGTGLAYPAKAERARRNPKVGMLIEGGEDDPVISIAGIAAVRDADLQTNLERYLAETILSPNIHPGLVPWETTRSRLYYLTRVIVCITPAHIRWWPNRASMDEAPTEWHAAADTVFPASDPAPAGKPSAPPRWQQRSWQDMAATALAQGLPAHLTLLDTEGFPIPIRVKHYRKHADGFALLVPRGAPWREGTATLSFVGKEIFIGEARRHGDEMILRVERALPVLPTVDDQAGRQQEIPLFDQRLADELTRRGQALPLAPASPPDPTAGCVLRAAAYGTLDSAAPGGRTELESKATR